MVEENSNFQIQKEQQQLKSLVEQIIVQAKKSGADACEVAASSTVGLSTTVRMGEVETIEFNNDKGFGITVYFGQRKGTASITDTSAEAVKASVEAACNIARYTEEDSCAGLADKEKMATHFPELHLYHPWNIDADQAIDLAKQCEQAGLDNNKITNSEGASVASYAGCSVYGNSHGFIGERHSSRHNTSCVLIAQKGDEMQRDYWYSTARDPADLEELKLTGQMAATKTVERLGSRKVKTGNYPIIFKADVAASLLGHFLGGISGDRLYRDASFLKDSLGTKLFPDWVHIHENPYLEKGFASSAYDSDGLQTCTRDFVTDGIVRSYILDTYSGRKLGLESTANSGGVRNLFLTSNAGSLEEMLTFMKDGLLVTDFIGSSVNMVTGNYSRGASGFWIENGAIAYPVAEITIAGNLKEMFASMIMVGSDIDKRKSTYTGSILIDKMMVAGT